MTIVDLYEEDNYGDIYLATIGKGLLKYNQPAEELNSPSFIKGKQTRLSNPSAQISQNELCLWAFTGKAPKIFNIPKQLITGLPFLIIITRLGTPKYTPS